MGEEAKRPKWEWGLPEQTFRKLTARRITKITHHWRFLTEDTSEHWIELHSELHTIKATSDVQQLIFKLFDFKPDHAGLIDLNYVGLQARKRIEEIDAFEKSNARERSEYERLKKKFGSAAPPSTGEAKRE